MNSLGKTMHGAIMLAKKADAKQVEPNPLVGAIITKKGKIIGKGCHEKYGESHAEINAIKNAQADLNDSEIFVTLEPCNHFGKTGPCAKAIQKTGIRTVHLACLDPNPKVHNGAKELIQKGVKVTIGLQKKEAEKLNKKFFKKFAKIKKPEITVKIAMTQKGFVTYGNGKTKKISGKKAFQYTQKLRQENDAVLVGVNTVLKDDPRLDVRKKNAKQPWKIILDTRLRVPLDAKVFSGKGKTVLVCSHKNSTKKIEKALEKADALVFVQKEKKGLSLNEAFEALAKLGLKKILIEPGKKLATSLLEQGFFDKLVLIVSPKRIENGVKAFKLKKTIKATVSNQSFLGKDLILVLNRK